MDDASAILNWTVRPWEMDPSGALLILSQDATSFTRFSITPSPETSIASLFGGAPGSPANR